MNFPTTDRWWSNFQKPPKERGRQMRTPSATQREDSGAAIQFGDITISLVSMTPAAAAAILERNTKNRPVKQALVKQISADMSGGTFMFNGDAIRIAEDGALLDGQHRLLACVATQCPFPAILVEGLPRETQHTVDKGSKRTFGDDLGIAGISDSKKVAAVVNAVIAIDMADDAGAGIGKGDSQHPGGFQLSSLPLGKRREVFDADADLFMLATRMGSRKAIGTVAGHTPASAAFYLLARVNQADAVEFFDRMAQPESEPTGSPAVALREKLIQDRLLAKPRIGKREQMALFIKAFNFWRDGASVTRQRLIWAPTREKFPSIREKDWDEPRAA